MGVFAVATASTLGCATYAALAMRRASPITDAAARVDMVWSGSAIMLHAAAVTLIASLAGAWASGMVDIDQLLASGDRPRDIRIALVAWFAVAFYATWAVHAVMQSFSAPQPNRTEQPPPNRPRD